MNKIEITDDYIARIDSQFELWASFLNTGVGLLAFTLAVASLGTESPVINAWLSIIVVLLVRIKGDKFFPKDVKELRQQSKEDAKAKLVLDGLEKRHFSFKTNFTKYPLLLIGFVMLMAVAFTYQIIKIFPHWGVYVGI